MNCRFSQAEALRMAIVGSDSPFAASILDNIIAHPNRDEILTSRDQQSRNVLHLAIMHRMQLLAERLLPLMSPVQLATKDADGLPPLYYAIKERFLKITTVLFNHSHEFPASECIWLTRNKNNGRFLLHEIVANLEEDETTIFDIAFSHLIKKSNYINIINYYDNAGKSAVYFACERQKHYAMRRFLLLNVAFDLPASDGTTAMDKIMEMSSQDQLSFFLSLPEAEALPLPARSRHYRLELYTRYRQYFNLHPDSPKLPILFTLAAKLKLSTLLYALHDFKPMPLYNAPAAILLFMPRYAERLGVQAILPLEHPTSDSKFVKQLINDKQCLIELSRDIDNFNQRLALEPSNSVRYRSLLLTFIFISFGVLIGIIICLCFFLSSLANKMNNIDWNYNNQTIFDKQYDLYSNLNDEFTLILIGAIIGSMISIGALLAMFFCFYDRPQKFLPQAWGHLIKRFNKDVFDPIQQLQQADPEHGNRLLDEQSKNVLQTATTALEQPQARDEALSFLNQIKTKMGTVTTVLQATQRPFSAFFRERPEPLLNAPSNEATPLLRPPHP